MDSQEIKEMLDGWLEEILEDIATYNENDLEKALGKWKRLSKSKNESGQWQRVFHNTYLDKKVLVVEGDIKGFLADGKYIFHISPSCHVAVSDYKYFKTDGCQSDWHLSGFVIFPEFMAEECEGYFESREDFATTKDSLLNLGFVEDEKFSVFVEKFM